MKKLVVYDSLYGNTKKVAEEVAKTIHADILNVQEAKYEKEKIQNSDLLVVGCPIQGWRPSEPTRDFLNSLPKDSLQQKQVAAFETRIDAFYSGSAAGKVLKVLSKLGGTAISEPGKFVVLGTEGPLADGELEKAVEWSKQLQANAGKA